MPNKRKPGRPRKSEAPAKRDIGRPEWHELGMRRLAAAIIMGAVKDYRKAGRRLLRVKAKPYRTMDKRAREKRRRDIQGLNAEMESIRRFFRGDRFARLSTLDPEWVIERLDSQIAKGGDPK